MPCVMSVKKYGQMVLALGAVMAGGAQAANESSVVWALDNQKNQNIKLLMPAFSGSLRTAAWYWCSARLNTPNKSGVFGGVTASCSRSPALAKSYQVTTYPAAENGGRFKLALPKHLARCFKVDPKGEISVAMEFRAAPVEELVSLRGKAFIE